MPQEGAYCGGTDEGGTPTCVANPPDCGRLAHACCAVDGRSSTLYSCNEGLYCPEPGDTSSGGSSGGGGGGSGGVVLLSDVGSGSRVCQECTPLVDQRYHVSGRPGASCPPACWLPGWPGAPTGATAAIVVCSGTYR